MNQHDEESASAAKFRIHQIEPDQVDLQLASGTVAIDVRGKDDHAKGTVPGAVNISITSLTESIAETVPDKTTPIICFCNGGNRGTQAAAKLLDLGYTNVSSISGGLHAYNSSKTQK